MSATTDSPIRNGVDTATLFATLDAVKGNNDIAKFQFRASNNGSAARTVKARSRASTGPVHRLRGALRAVFAATTDHRSPEAPALAEINRALRAVAPIELTASAEGYTIGHRHLGDPVDDALGRLAQVVLRAVTDGDIGRLRLCANPRCRTAFRDTSRAGTRLWCDMTTCGNRAKGKSSPSQGSRRRGVAQQPGTAGEASRRIRPAHA